MKYATFLCSHHCFNFNCIHPDDSLKLDMKKRKKRKKIKIKNFTQILFATKNKSSIYQQEFNGGVAQLVRARDS